MLGEHIEALDKTNARGWAAHPDEIAGIADGGELSTLPG